MLRGGVLLTTYGTCASDPGALGAAACCGEFEEWDRAAIPRSQSRSGVVWDIAVLDEGHKIKNPSTHVHKAMQAIPSRYRLLLSGTPIQNSENSLQSPYLFADINPPPPHPDEDLDELWSLVDYFSWGTLLGTRRQFNIAFADKIIAGRDKNAAINEMRQGEEAASQLMDLIRPHLLRREKEVLRKTASCEVASDIDALSAGVASLDLKPSVAAFGKMGTKKEVVVWCAMTASQVCWQTPILRTLNEMAK